MRYIKKSKLSHLFPRVVCCCAYLESLVIGGLNNYTVIRQSPGQHSRGFANIFSTMLQVGSVTTFTFEDTTSDEHLFGCVLLSGPGNYLLLYHFNHRPGGGQGTAWPIILLRPPTI